MKIIRQIVMLALGVCAATTLAGPNTEVEPSYAWKLIPPLGLHQPATIDTTYIDYCRESVPSAITDAYATTGNLGSSGIDMIYFSRPEISDFFFRDAIDHWIPSIRTMKFYNTRIPMTLMSYNFGGGKQNSQERLSGIFSGNINQRAQVGALFDYLYSKGCYNYQADKNLTWGFSGSYIGDRYEFQGYFNHYNLINQENGGITNDLYITDPAEVQGGSTKVDVKTIPTNLTSAHSRIVGTELLLNHRYKVGYYHHEQVNDSTVKSTYIPVSSFIWTLAYNDAKHLFVNKAPGEAKFWDATYLYPAGTYDRTTYSTLTNTLGIDLLEGFHKYAKFGLGAYVTYQLRSYHQTNPTVTQPEEGQISNLTPLPANLNVPEKENENLVWIGAQLTKQHGSILTYQGDARIGMIGDVAADLALNGHIDTRVPMLGDTASARVYARFTNQAAPYLLNHYISNHFAWSNSFDKERKFRFGGSLRLPLTSTLLEAGIENIQNLLYFNNAGLPAQHSSSIRVFSATASQHLAWRALNLDARATLQTSSQAQALPLPKVAVYANLYCLFRIAKVLKLQVGVDCDYYTRYYGLAYQPATMTFHTQDQIKVGGFPMMNLYANMRLSRTTFYLLFSHFNQGLIGSSDYFSSPHYPLNPSRLLMGLKVDFAN